MSVPRWTAWRLGLATLAGGLATIVGLSQGGGLRPESVFIDPRQLLSAPVAAAGPVLDSEQLEGTVLKKRCYCGIGQLIVGTLDGPTLVRMMPLSEKDKKRRNDDFHKQRGQEDRQEQDDEYAACDDISVGDYLYVNDGVRQTATLWDGYRISFSEGDRQGSTQKASDCKEDDGDEEDRLEEPAGDGPSDRADFPDAALMLEAGSPGTLLADDGKIRVEVGAGLFSQPAVLVVRSVEDEAIPSAPGASGPRLFFELALESCDEKPPAISELPGNVQLSASLGSGSGRPELARWDGRTKAWLPISTTLSADQKQVSTPTDRVGTYALYLKPS